MELKKRAYIPLASNAAITISFKVTVITIPTPNPIPNAATGAYTFTVNPSININNVQQSGASPGTGITIPDINPRSTTTITYSVNIKC